MPDSSDVHEFPDLSNKLAAPTKKSLFERQKAEAEAKRQREEAETAAVLQDFVKSFEDDGGSTSRPSNFRSDNIGFNSGSGPSKRHFTGPPTGPGGGRGGLSSTRGTLPSSGPGSLGAPSSWNSKKRSFDTSFDTPKGKTDTATVFQTSDNEDDGVQDSEPAERTVPKPTIQLSSLPPGISTAVIKAMMPPNLTVDGIRISGASTLSSTEKKSTTAIVTLAKDTPASDIDSAVNSLQNRYMGWGYKLALSRHLSSAALGANAPMALTIGSNSSSMPFGAKTRPSAAAGSLSRAPPPSSIHKGGYAPPSSYNTIANDEAQVAVKPPADLKQIRLIHKTVEAVINHGPEFEALLMSRPEVQTDERWAWIWDARSEGGVWYRWRLWEIMSGSGFVSKSGRSQIPRELFDNGPFWMPPTKSLGFQYNIQIDSVISDSDYDSSAEEASDDEDQARPNFRDDAKASHLDPMGSGISDERPFLTPFHKAKLAFLLARLPTSTSKLRKGDIARVTAFAVKRAGEGADEVVEMIVSNVLRPYAYTSANPEREVDTTGRDDGDSDEEHLPGGSDSLSDHSAAQLVGLYVVSDILSCSSTSGVRHAWKYRQLFETALMSRKIFETLGRLEKTLKWGRLRAEKWRRAIGSLLTLWEGWCVFPAKAQERIVEVFHNPPLTESEQNESRRKEQEESKAAKSNRWKAVDGDAKQDVSNSKQSFSIKKQEELDGEPMDDIDGEPMDDDDLDGVPMEDIDGEPMSDGIDGQSMEIEAPSKTQYQQSQDILQGEGGQNGSGMDLSQSSNNGARKRQRPRAEDMFADSDSD